MHLSENTIISLAQLPWYTEGPVTDQEGNVYATTLAGKEIIKIDISGHLSVWAKGNYPNGQIILPSGDHLVCDSGNASISRYDNKGDLMNYDIQKTCAGITVNKPNDLVSDSSGGIYFTDSVRHKGKVFYYHPDGFEKLIADNLDFPNGIALNSDQTSLFVAESYQNRILQIPADNGASLSPFNVFCNLPQHHSGKIIDNLPDGLKTDRAGNLWVAHYGMGMVQVINPAGEWKTSYPVNLQLPSNLCLADDFIIVTGGQKEPGPGGILKINKI
ncbi:MAG: SMP-30/gluconolactonase/LRE family protein, partial [Chitinophagaceae bacterium]|nr:SMP-30/gluconolactonase/LRE family protein [Chitinophagaceae bacterium]